MKQRETAVEKPVKTEAPVKTETPAIQFNKTRPTVGEGKVRS